MENITVLIDGQPRLIEYVTGERPCANCGVETFNTLCSPCAWLSRQGKVRRWNGIWPNGWAETEGTMNRRWQTWFNNRSLPDCRGDGWGGIKWERKRNLQDW